MIQPIKQVKWRSLVAEQQASGQSVVAFCRTEERPQFVELEVAKSQLRPKQSCAALGSSIEVRLSNGRSLMVPPDFDASHLRALLAIVESWS